MVLFSLLGRGKKRAFENLPHPQITDCITRCVSDNGGIREAYRAYRDYLSRSKLTRSTGPALPGLGEFDSDQLFFMSYATVWCEAKTKGQLAAQLATDVHPPNVARVTSVLRNMPEFAEAFNCKAGDFMVAEKPCKIW